MQPQDFQWLHLVTLMKKKNLQAPLDVGGRGQTFRPPPPSWQAVNAPPLGVWTWCPADWSGSVKLNHGTAVPGAVSNRPEDRGPGQSSSIHSGSSSLSVSINSEQAFWKRRAATSGRLGISPCGRMEVEKRTNGFDYPERSNAKSVNGRLKHTFPHSQT